MMMTALVTSCPSSVSFFYAVTLRCYHSVISLLLAAVCGMYGYSDLFTMDWLDVILSWQKAEGCYGYSDKRRGGTVFLKKVQECYRFTIRWDSHNSLFLNF